MSESFPQESLPLRCLPDSASTVEPWSSTVRDQVLNKVDSHYMATEVLHWGDGDGWLLLDPLGSSVNLGPVYVFKKNHIVELSWSCRFRRVAKMFSPCHVFRGWGVLDIELSVTSWSPPPPPRPPAAFWSGTNPVINLQEDFIKWQLVSIHLLLIV